MFIYYVSIDLSRNEMHVHSAFQSISISIFQNFHVVLCSLWVFGSELIVSSEDNQLNRVAKMQ